MRRHVCLAHLRRFLRIAGHMDRLGDSLLILPQAGVALTCIPPPHPTIISFALHLPRLRSYAQPANPQNHNWIIFHRFQCAQEFDRPQYELAANSSADVRPSAPPILYETSAEKKRRTRRRTVIFDASITTRGDPWQTDSLSRRISPGIRLNCQRYG